MLLTQESGRTITAANNEPRPLGFDGSLDRAPFACIRLNERGVITAANLAACALLELRLDRRVRPVMSAFLAPHEMARFFTFLQHLMKSPNELRLRLEMRCPGRRQWWCDLAGRAQGDGTILVSLSDVTEQHNGIETLRLSEERTRALLESLPDAVFVVQDGLIVEANAAAESLVDCAPIGRPFASFVDAHQRSLVASRLASRQCEKLERHELTFVPVRGDLHTRIIETTWLPITVLGQHATVCVARDRTIERERNDRTAQHDRLATAGVLAAGVAHELNNPLTYMTMHLDELIEQLSSVDTTDAKNAADLAAIAVEARDGADRMAKIVGDLRGVASVEDRQRPVNLNAVVDRSLSLMAAHLRGRIEVVRDLGQLVPVRANEGQLTQVISNLLMNAAQAIGDTRGRIVVSTAASRDRVSLTVSDTGPGVPASVAPKLFEPFVTSKDVGEGTGLGLYVCNRFVRMCGGEISWRNLPEGGAEFRVDLMLAAEGTAGVERDEPSIEATSGEPLRILVVDDEPQIRTLVGRQLGSLGEVTLAAGAVEALQLLENGERYSVILCDLLMPELGGRGFYGEVRKRFAQQLPALCFMSGGAVQTADCEFVETMEPPLLAKPFSTRDLRTFVSRRAGSAARQASANDSPSAFYGRQNRRH